MILTNPQLAFATPGVVSVDNQLALLIEPHVVPPQHSVSR